MRTLAGVILSGLLAGCTTQITKPKEPQPSAESTQAKSHYQRAVHLQRKHRDPEAMAELQAVLALKPDHLPSLILLGTLSNRYNQGDRAFELFQAALRLDPNLAEVHFDIGTIYQGRGDEQNAITQYRLAIAADSRHRFAHNNLGVIHLNQGMPDLALEEFQKVIEIDPQDRWVYSSVGHAHMAKREWDAALRAFEKAISDSAADHISVIGRGLQYLDLGEALHETQRFGEARQAFQKALEYLQAIRLPAPDGEQGGSVRYFDPPNFARGCYGLARAEARRGDQAEAMESLALAIRYDPSYRQRAAQEPDFSVIRSSSRFQELLRDK